MKRGFVWLVGVSVFLTAAVGCLLGASYLGLNPREEPLYEHARPSALAISACGAAHPLFDNTGRFGTRLYEATCRSVETRSEHFSEPQRNKANPAPTQGYPLPVFQQRIREAHRRLAASSRVIRDSDLIQYARTPFDKGAKMLKREYLGANHGELVVVDFPCSDVCPQYTKRIIHYDVSANRGDCFAAGGVIREEDVPTGIANESVKFCEPRILVKSGGIGALLDRIPQR